MPSPKELTQPREFTASPMPAGFDVRIAQDRDTVVLSLYGELDLAGQARILDACEHALRGGQAEIVIDLGALTYIDSTGLRALLGLRRQALARRIRLMILPGPPQVQRAFDAGGVRHAFTIVEHV